jgi:signal peptidase II
MIWIVIILGIASIDQLLKYLVVNNMQIGTSIAVIDNFFQITYVRNSGIAFSIFQDGNFVMIPVMILISGVLIYFLIKSDSLFMSVSMAFIVGGALGNLIDRVFRGRVVDYIDFQLNGRHFFIFNFADMFVVIGTALLIFYLLFIYKEKEKI